MTTSTVFAPTAAGAFQFGVTLDGNDYVCNLTWNLWAQRWYLNVYTVSGDLVIARALIASPPGYSINLLFGYFSTSTMSFDDASQTFLVSP